MAASAVHLTLEEFLERPDRNDDLGEELIEGELILSPGAKVWHADIVRRLWSSLSMLERKRFALANDFSCILGKTSMPAPDLAAVRLERWDQAVRNDGWLEGSPELAVEVSFPSNRRLQRKAALYLNHGAEQVWLVYRKTRTVTILTPKCTTKASIGDSLQFHGVKVLVDSLFPQLLTPVRLSSSPF